MYIIKRIKNINTVAHCSGGSHFSVEKIDPFSHALPSNYHSQCYSVAWLESGNGKIQLGRNKSCISSNTIFSIRAGQSAVFACETKAIGVAISFTPDFMESSSDTLCPFSSPLSAANFHVIDGIKLIDEDIIFLKSIVRLMAAEAADNNAFRLEILKRLLNLLFTHLLENATFSRNSTAKELKTSLFSRFEEYLEKYFTTKKQVQDYATLLQVTASHLNSSIRHTTGFPASFHIQQRILREAKRRAFEDRTTMKEISYALGFTDQSHFSKYFKNACGKSFKEFRTEIFNTRFQV